MLSKKEVIDFWAKKLKIGQEGKTKKKRRTLREAKKAQRQSGYGDKLGGKAVRTQREKKRDLKRIAEGKD